MVITEKNETGKMFGPIKTCIYCGATTNGSRRLKDEHIFQLCLCGVYQIFEAN